MTDSRASLVGIVLAAGAGRRFGGPKALARLATGEAFVAHAATTLYAGGLPRVVVVLGAAADAARGLVPSDPWCSVVVAEDWAEGMGASLRAGLAAVGPDVVEHRGRADEAVGDAVDAVDAVVVTLVDLPDLAGDVVARLVARTLPAPATAADARRALGRAAYAGVPGHPVLIGRDHWPRVAAAAHGDEGARSVFAAYPHVTVECGDLATGHDVDHPPDGGSARESSGDGA